MTQDPQWPAPEQQPTAAPSSVPVPPAVPPPGPAVQPGWGPPPAGSQQPGWGPSPSTGQPPAWGGTPNWGSAPAWGGTPNWGSAPNWGLPGASATPRPKPGIIPLRPIALGEIYDGSFQAIRSNPRTMIGLSAIVLACVTAAAALPQALLLRSASGLLADATPTLENTLASLNGSVEASGISAFFTFVAVQLVTAMLVFAVSAAVLGERLHPGEAWRRLRSRSFAVLGLAALQLLVMLLAFVLPWLPGLLITLAGAPLVGIPLAVLGVLGSIALVLFLSARWAFAVPALLLEEQRVVASLRRSFQLVRGSTWRVLGIGLLTQLIIGFGTAIIQTPFGLVGSIFVLTEDTPYASFWGNLGYLLTGGVGQVVAGAVFYPFAAAVTTLLYVDVRMRREGLDVELIRSSEGGPTT